MSIEHTAITTKEVICPRKFMEALIRAGYIGKANSAPKLRLVAMLDTHVTPSKDRTASIGPSYPGLTAIVYNCRQTKVKVKKVSVMFVLLYSAVLSRKIPTRIDANTPEAIELEAKMAISLDE